MEIKDMTTEQLEARRLEIVAELDNDNADLNALEAEARAIKDELEARKANEKKRNEVRSMVAAGAGVEVRKFEEPQGKKEKTVEEIRASREYIDAFARYIKSGDDSECRSLLTKNSSVSGNPGQVPVPTVIEGRIRTAWERNGLLDLVRRTYVRGNLQVGFELTATGAVVHAEGTAAPTEEALTFGVVNLVPQSIKKWIRISDEAIDLGGEEFLDYIYDELTYQIAKEAKRLLITAITSAPAASTASAVGVPAITGASSNLGIVAQAVANLSDEATRPVAVMNRLTHADFIAAMASNGYRFDPFDGVEVHYDNTLPAYSAASAGATWMIVGDFSGAQMNFPNGGDIRIKYDDMTEAQADLVKLVGRMYVAIGVTGPGMFVKVTKASA